MFYFLERVRRGGEKQSEKQKESAAAESAH
jgi:hypothetical protein